MRRSPQTIETIEAQIAKAAIELGPNLESFSVQDLARHAQIAIGTIYRIYQAKTALHQSFKNMHKASLIRWFLPQFAPRVICSNVSI